MRSQPQPTAPSRAPLSSFLLGLIVGLAWACGAASEIPEVANDSSQAESILDLQPMRQVSRVELTRDGQRGLATLINLNPRINAWFVLELEWPGLHARSLYHLENPDRKGTSVSLLGPDGLLLESTAERVSCPLWSKDGPLEQARRTALPYAPLCGDRLYLRNAVAGTYTRLERVTDFLRDHVWGGDQIVTFVRKRVFQDWFAEQGAERVPGASVPSFDPRLPQPARIEPGHEMAIEPESLGIDVSASGALAAGQWYPVNGVPGIYVSAVQPQSIAAPILGSFPRLVDPLDATEGRAVDYLVAFDLTQLDLKFALGTDHPRLDWSGRETPQMHASALPGPDGIATAAPLVRTGMVSPSLVGRTVATFAGGFKREHGAFRYGALAARNHGSHYGFVEEGVVFSTLQPGLATVYVLNDGTADLSTWGSSDIAHVPDIRFARQNGVPLIEPGTASSDGSIPGSLVRQWGAGNWSGSADERLRTLRAGLCLQQTPTRRFLVYGYFSTATPSAMVRVFQAYGCRYAMHLDMNALEHTYLALYTHTGGQVFVQHLIQGMEEVDRKGGGGVAPRFLAFPDDRDFFYLTRRGLEP